MEECLPSAVIPCTGYCKSGNNCDTSIDTPLSTSDSVSVAILSGHSGGKVTQFIHTSAGIKTKHHVGASVCPFVCVFLSGHK